MSEDTIIDPVTIHEDMTATIETETHFCRLGSNHPSEQRPWASEDELRAFAEGVLSDPRYMTLKSSIPAERYRLLTVYEYKELVRLVTQMTPAQNRAWAEDPSDEAFMVRERLADYGAALIDINTDRGMVTIEAGLDIMAALGHVGSLTAATLKPAVLAAWPQE